MKKVVLTTAFLFVCLFLIFNKNELVDNIEHKLITENFDEQIDQDVQNSKLKKKSKKDQSKAAAVIVPPQSIDKKILRVLDFAKREKDKIAAKDKNIFALLDHLEETHDLIRQKERSKALESKTYESKDKKNSVHLIFDRKENNKLRNVSYRNQDDNVRYMATTNYLTNSKNALGIREERKITFYSNDGENRDFGDKDIEVSYVILKGEVTDIVYFDLDSDLVYVTNVLTGDFTLYDVSGDKEVIYNYDGSGNLIK